jgi:hypothetical protein
VLILCEASPALIGFAPGLPPPFTVVAQTGDQILDDKGNLVPKLVDKSGVKVENPLKKNFVSLDLKLNWKVVTPKAQVNPTTVYLGDGHMVSLPANSKLEALNPITINDPQQVLDGTAVYLHFGEAVVDDTGADYIYPSPLSLAYRWQQQFRESKSTVVIVRTKGTTTGAKGTQITVAYDLLSSSTTVVNYTAALCWVYRGTDYSSHIEVPIGQQTVTLDNNPVGMPQPIKPPPPPHSNPGARPS